MLAGLHGRDRVQDGGVDKSIAGREPEERPQRAQFLLDGLELVARQGGDERLDRAGVTIGHPAACVQERDELPGHRRIGPHGRHGPVGGPQPRLESGDGVGPVPGQPADAAGVAAQDRPVDRVVAQHLRDPEQVDIGGLEGAGLLLGEEAAGLVDPHHRQVPGELLHTNGGEELLQAAPAAPIPDHRRVLVAQTHQLRVQVGHQRRHRSTIAADLQSRGRHHAGRVLRVPGLCAALDRQDRP